MNFSVRIVWNSWRAFPHLLHKWNACNENAASILLSVKFLPSFFRNLIFSHTTSAPLPFHFTPFNIIYIFSTHIHRYILQPTLVPLFKYCAMWILKYFPWRWFKEFIEPISWKIISRKCCSFFTSNNSKYIK